MIYLTRRTFDPKTEPAIPPSNKPERYIVQFNKSLTGKERKELRTQYKLALDQYIPNFAFLELLDFDTLTALSANSLHRASALLQTKDKISPGIDRHILNQDRLLLRVLLFPSLSNEEILKVVEALRKLLGPVESRKDDGAQEEIHTNGRGAGKFGIELKPGEIRVHDDRKLGGDVHLVLFLRSLDLLPLIAKLDEVQWIEEVVESSPDRTTTLTNVATNTFSGTIQTGDPTRTPLWDNGITGTGQRIGIIDHTRVDVYHCMFKDNPGIAFGDAHRKVVGWRPVIYLSNNDHGPAVAAIAAGDELNNSGANPNRGVAWNAKISYDDKKCIGRYTT